MVNFGLVLFGCISESFPFFQEFHFLWLLMKIMSESICMVNQSPVPFSFNKKSLPRIFWRAKACRNYILYMTKYCELNWITNAFTNRKLNKIPTSTQRYGLKLGFVSLTWLSWSIFFWCFFRLTSEEAFTFMPISKVSLRLKCFLGLASLQLGAEPFFMILSSRIWLSLSISRTLSFENVRLDLVPFLYLQVTIFR